MNDVERAMRSRISDEFLSKVLVRGQRPNLRAPIMPAALHNS
jgi:hypothetical protein